MMRFRKVRKIWRWNTFRTFSLFIGCFIIGMFYGILKEDTKPASVHASNDRVGEPWKPLKEESIENMGRKKLSIIGDKATPKTFSKLPANFEEIVQPPRVPASRFTLIPNKVLERNRDAETQVSHYFMIFLVKSAPTHYSRRDIIRRTWGAVKRVDNFTFNTIFLLSDLGGNEPLQEKLREENSIHGDILQSNAPEGYRNLPLKVLSGMQWLIVNSDQLSSDLYTFTDDDCVIHIGNVVDFFGSMEFTEEDTRKTNIKNSPASTSVVATSEMINVGKANPNNSTLSIIHSVKAESEKGLTEKVHYKLVASPVFYQISEVKSARVENDDAIMQDPNAKIQIKRTGREDDVDVLHLDPSSEDNFEEISTVRTPTNASSDLHNEKYENNTKDLDSFLKSGLKTKNTPGEIFEKRKLVHDALYCGYCYSAISKPHRNLKTKWGVPMKLYSEESYPQFCHGGMYSMSGSKMRAIFSISTVTDYRNFHLEDVLITGILREKSGVPGSGNIHRGSDPKTKPLMYYAWDSGPRLMFKMSRKWRIFAKSLIPHSFVMDAMINGKLVKWDNKGKQ